MSRQTRHNSLRMLQAVLAVAMEMATPLAFAATSPQAVRGDTNALTQITIAHYEKNDFGHAFDEFAEAAQRGNRLAQFNYTMMLIRDEGTVARPGEAVKWLRRAADNQMAHVQFAYGELFERGELVPRSLEEANKQHERAAVGGHVEAQRALVTDYFTERGMSCDYGRAFSWYEKATEGGDVPSQYIVGSYYKRDEPGVVPQDIEQTKKWYGRAAAQGDVGALGKLHELVEKTYRAEYGDLPTAARRSM